MALPAGYLSKKGGRWRPVQLIDIMTLLYNIHAGAAVPDVGFEDARETVDTITRKLDRKKVFIDPSVLESALCSCNMMNETGKFWDPRGRTFDEFVRQLLGSDKFNRFYNVIEGQNE